MCIRNLLNRAFFCTLFLSLAICDILTAADKPRVTLIRDYHCHYDTQKAISSIIGQLNHEYPIPVLLEGAYGAIDLSFMSRYPDLNAVESVSDELLKKGMFSGAEYLSVLSANSLYGIDDRRYYLMSYDIFQRVTARETELQLLLSFLGNKIETLTQSLSSQKFKDFVILRDQFAEESVALPDYLDALENNFSQYVKFDRYPHIKRFLDMRDRLSLMSPDQIEASRKSFFSMALGMLNQSDMMDLRKCEVQYRMHALTAVEYKSFIESVFDQDVLADDRFVLFLDSLTLESSLLNMTKDIDLDNERLQWDVFHSTALTPAERTIGELIFFKDYCRNLFSFSVPGYKIGIYRDVLDRIDFDSLYALIERFDSRSVVYDIVSNLLATVESCFEFYDFSLKRDAIMADNIDAWFDLHQDCSEFAVVCGAMHIDRLKDVLSKRGYSVLVRIPHVPAHTVHQQNNVYLERMMGQPLSFDGFTISPVNLAFACLFSNDPFVDQVAYLNTILPLELAIKIALVSKSINSLLEESEDTPHLVDTVMQHIDMILVEFYAEHDLYQINVTSIKLSENRQLIAFDLEIINTQTNKPYKQYRITPEVAENALNIRNAVSLGNSPAKTVEEMKAKFKRSLQSTKARFDGFLELAGVQSDEVGPFLFGPTFMRLNRVSGKMMERFHHKNHALRTDGYVMPYQHALDVAMNININDVHQQYHRVMRLSAVFHNLWRVYCTYDDFKLKRNPASRSVAISAIDPDGQSIKLTGTLGEISAGLVPVVLREMNIDLEDWELQLLTRLIITSDMFGVIGQEWDADYARSAFKISAQNADIPFEDYLSLARRLYEADILTIYTSNLTGEPRKEVESLLDISDKIDTLLDRKTQVVGVPVEGAEKELFFASLSLRGPDFMRMITHAMADDAYAAEIFPQALLDLKNIPDKATPVIHQDPETNRAINPFTHSINAAILVNIGEITNIRALRIAMLLHDIGKLKFESFQSDGYAFHAEASATMIDDTLEQWGIKEHLSNEEVVLIKFLVANHDMLNRHTQPSTMWQYNIPKIIEILQPPSELEAAGFTFFTMLKYARRVMQADANSVPKLKGKLDFNGLENMFASKFLREHPDLWPKYESKYSPNVSLSSGQHIITMAATKMQGNDNGYVFEDPSDDITKPFAPEPIRPLDILTGRGKQLLEHSL